MLMLFYKTSEFQKWNSSIEGTPTGSYKRTTYDIENSFGATGKNFLIVYLLLARFLYSSFCLGINFLNLKINLKFNRVSYKVKKGNLLTFIDSENQDEIDQETINKFLATTVYEFGSSIKYKPL